MERVAHNIPTVFCWTRFGTEAGETVEEILARKERERLANDGTFLWGIGNSIAPAVTELLRTTPHPEVLFSPIKSRPRAIDVAPSMVVRWAVAETLAGERRSIPATFDVRGGYGSEKMTPRYALVCQSIEPLVPSDLGVLYFGSLRNLLSGSPLGASQVTAVVRRDDNSRREASTYPVVLRARLVDPYFVRLRVPVRIDDPRVQRPRSFLESGGDMLRPLESY
jgi:hypothetical protein